MTSSWGQGNDDLRVVEVEKSADESVGSKRKEAPATDSSSIRPKVTRNVPQRSDIWQHFTRLPEDKDRCKCNYCGRLLSCASKSETSGMRNHLGICKAYKVIKEQKSQPNLTQDGAGNVMSMTVTQEVFREATNEMLVMGELPLAFVEGLAFKHFCSRVLPSYTIHSRRSATRDIVDMYMKEKAALKSLLSRNKQRVSLTTDIWTAPTTNASYMVITAHYIDTNWQMKKKIIGFKHINDHKGATIAAQLLECLDDWCIEKVFAITVDNATANTSALKIFRDTMKMRGNDALVLDGDFMHVRCCTHIMNLIVRDGLQEIDHSVDAIRNAVTYVRSSSQRLKSFELRVDSCKMTRGSLPLDIKTRWDSTHHMLTMALQFRLAFDKIIVEDKLYCDYFHEEDEGKKKKRMGPPTAKDWDDVQRLVKFLTIFHESTLAVSGSNYTTSSSCYSAIVNIETNLLILSKSSNELLKTKAETMRDKFDKYWEGFDNINKLLIIACVFDPNKKMQFPSLCFEKLYGKDTTEYMTIRESVQDVLHMMFQEYNAVLNKHSAESVGTSSQFQDRDESSDGLNILDNDGFERMDSLYNQIVNERRNEHMSNELDIYLLEKVVLMKNKLGLPIDILSWWRVNSPKFPVLSEMARDILAMQVSSVASEAAFSTSGRILDPYRSCLSHWMIEALMCTEQWLHADLRFKENDVLSIPQMVEEAEYMDNLEQVLES